MHILYRCIFLLCCSLFVLAVLSVSGEGELYSHFHEADPPYSRGKEAASKESGYVGEDHFLSQAIPCTSTLRLETEGGGLPALQLNLPVDTRSHCELPCRSFPVCCPLSIQWVVNRYSRPTIYLSGLALRDTSILMK